MTNITTKFDDLVVKSRLKEGMDILLECAGALFNHKPEFDYPQGKRKQLFGLMHVSTGKFINMKSYFFDNTTDLNNLSKLDVYGMVNNDDDDIIGMRIDDCLKEYKFISSIVNRTHPFTSGERDCYIPSLNYEITISIDVADSVKNDLIKIVPL